jgi:hypothetical protein
LEARIAFRALIGAGLFLAWLGLLLAWESGPAEGSVGGFEASPPFAIGLAVATVLAVPALWREWSWAFVALAVAALVLVWLAVRRIAEAAEAASAFVSVMPGVGAILALVGAAALVVAVIVALRPHGLQLAGGLAAFALVTGGAAAWPQDGGRPGGGEIAVAVDGPAPAPAFQGDTLYSAGVRGLFAHPTPDRRYFAAPIPEVDDAAVGDLVFAGDTAYLALDGVERLVAIAPDGEHRVLVARRRREGTLVLDDFVAGPLAAGPDGSVYVLQRDAVVRWQDGRVERLAPRFGDARDIASDARGRLYVADTGNGRVHRIDPDGAVHTLVGTDAPRDCVEDGLDDPLALDPSRCTAVKALAVDRAGNVYMALESVGMIVGVAPDGRMRVVAGTGPKGFGGGEAVQARLGVVEALAVGPDGDLYVSESAPVERVRRIADPAGILGSEPPEPEEPPTTQACAEIAALNVAATGVGKADALERALNALAETAPDELVDDVDAIAAAATDRAAAERATRRAMGTGELGAYAEQECGLVGGFDVPVAEANEFCVAYARYFDQGDLAEAGEEPPRALPDVIAAAPEFLADAGRDVLSDLESAAGRAVPEATAELLLADVEALDAVAAAMCVVG